MSNRNSDSHSNSNSNGTSTAKPLHVCTSVSTLLHSTRVTRTNERTPAIASPKLQPHAVQMRDAFMSVSYSSPFLQGSSQTCPIIPMSPRGIWGLRSREGPLDAWKLPSPKLTWTPKRTPTKTSVACTGDRTCFHVSSVERILDPPNPFVP